MQNSLVIVLLAGCSVMAVQPADVVRFSMEETKAKEQTNGVDISREETKGRKPKLLGSFQWKNCGSPSKELMVVESLSIAPDPIAIPGTIKINFTAVFNKTVDAPLQVDLKLEKEEFGFWIEVPCIDNLGSCTYSDLCESLSQATCPLPFVQQKVPCKCPFNKGSYKLSNASFNIPTSGVPTGNYRITANLSVKGVFVGCYYIAATLTD
ncbi:ganglioside GM2 activator-like [Littorina saxatilis]|uniref:MD-2-related lipid-recognition domain-containing protein n=1 Tax=Littorina saxatilis TaxID=31220 RepID=A0AAN9B540_9CAEN